MNGKKIKHETGKNEAQSNQTHTNKHAYMELTYLIRKASARKLFLFVGLKNSLHFALPFRFKFIPKSKKKMIAVFFFRVYYSIVFRSSCHIILFSSIFLSFARMVKMLKSRFRHCSTAKMIPNFILCLMPSPWPFSIHPFLSFALLVRIPT